MRKEIYLIILLFLSSVGVILAQIQVEGRVVDENGDPIIGATIQVKGTDQGTITDVEGNFTLSISNEANSIIVSYVGMKSQELKVSSNMKIVLEQDVGLLDELVVVGYGTQKKKSLTGSVSMVESEELTEAPVPTVSEALVGKLAGVTTRQADARPGSSTSMQIRNLGTPLYVIDGVPQGQLQFNNLNPGDIESISILKDAAASIYGVRAANGVVLVTTKSGGLNKENQINFNATYSAVNYLVSKGYKKIKMLAYKLTLTHMQERIRGYKEAMQDNMLNENIEIKDIRYDFASEDINYNIKEFVDNKDTEAIKFAYWVPAIAFAIIAYYSSFVTRKYSN